jgi:hypothetical protein
MRKAIGPDTDRDRDRWGGHRARGGATAVGIDVGLALVPRLLILIFVLGAGGCATVPKNLRNLNAGCEQGSGSSCFQLGVAYHEGKDEKGEFVDLNFAKARKAFERACDRESSTGCYNLGFMLQKGEGGTIDKPRALGFYKRGCELGDGSACLKAAVAFRDGDIVGVKKDAELATFYARRGCDRDVKEACDLIGARPPGGSSMGGGGSGSGGDGPASAGEVSDMIKACKDGNADACFAAAVRFDEGKGVPVNKQEAVTGYRIACEKGDPRGCHNLGIMLIDGEGIPKNLDQGIKNLNTACERGLKRSCDALVGIMDRECQRGNADACTILGGWVLRGKNGLETNVQRGVGLLRKGCQMGDKDACDVLRQLNVPE